MNEIIKKRYQELKDRNSNFVREKKWESNALLQECLLALDNNKKILTIEQQQQILTKFNSDLTKLTDSYRKKSIKTIQELLPQWINKSVYIIWDKEDLIGVLQDIYAAYRMPIVFIIDEWDCVFREKKKIPQGRNNIWTS